MVDRPPAGQKRGSGLAESLLHASTGRSQARPKSLRLLTVHVLHTLVRRGTRRARATSDRPARPLCPLASGRTSPTPPAGTCLPAGHRVGGGGSGSRSGDRRPGTGGDPDPANPLRSELQTSVVSCRILSYLNNTVDFVLAESGIYGPCEAVEECDPVEADGCATPAGGQGWCSVLCQVDADCPEGPEGQQAVCSKIGKAKVCKIP